MHEISDSETVPYTVRQMFTLVADVDRYPEFLPWCRAARIVRREKDDVVVAEIQVGYGPVHTTFSTRNTHRVDRAIEMDLVDGPFEFLKGSWQFQPHPGGGCHMRLELQFKFARHHLEAPFAHMFKTSMGTVVHAFEDRARDLYGAP